LIEGEANYATYVVKSNSPPGGLRDHVSMEQVTKDTAYAGFRVKNTDKKAYWWEYGTAIRHTKLGWNRGQMIRPHGTLVDAVVQARARMWVALRELLQRKGLIVTG
jgi:hypothetical protein